MPTFIAVPCPHCHRDQVVKRGKTARGTQRYLCQNKECATGSFLLGYYNRGCLPEVKELIIDMSLNASGIRDMARSLHISTDTVLSELKKKAPVLESVNTILLNTLNPDEVTVDIERAGEAEMDEMWSFVGRKTNLRWLWHAIDHQTGEVLAYVFGRRKDEVFLKLKALLDPFGLTHYYTDKWGAYTRHLDPEQHTISKRGYTENRAQAFDATHPHQTPGAEDDLLLEIDADARHRHWIVYQSICFWTGGVIVVISTIRTPPKIESAYKRAQVLEERHENKITRERGGPHQGYYMRLEFP